MIDDTKDEILIEMLSIKDGKFTLGGCSGGNTVSLLGNNDAFIRLRHLNKLTCEMVQIYVDDSKRLRGNGRKIIEEYERICRERGYKYSVIKSNATIKEIFGKFVHRIGYRYFGNSNWLKKL